jgi:hypothetical protein
MSHISDSILDVVGGAKNKETIEENVLDNKAVEESNDNDDVKEVSVEK